MRRLVFQSNVLPSSRKSQEQREGTATETIKSTLNPWKKRDSPSSYALVAPRNTNKIERQGKRRERRDRSYRIPVCLALDFFLLSSGLLSSKQRVKQVDLPVNMGEPFNPLVVEVTVPLEFFFCPTFVTKWWFVPVSPCWLLWNASHLLPCTHSLGIARHNRGRDSLIRSRALSLFFGNSGKNPFPSFSSRKRKTVARK